MRTTQTSRIRRTALKRVLPAVAAASVGITGLVGCSSAGAAGTDDAKADSAAKSTVTSRDTKADAGKQKAAQGVRKMAAGTEFPTWGTDWVVHQTPDTNSPKVGTLNAGAPGKDKIVADHQVDTGKKVCEGDACSTFMAHITGPVNGYVTVVAADIPEDRLPGVPVQGGGQQPPPPAPAPGDRGEALKRAATWLTANNGRQVPYSQTARWKDGYRQDCSGYVAMALGLKAPGPNTVGLTDPAFTKPIALNDLKPGDLLIDAAGDNNTRHVVMFEKWDNPQHSSYTAYEQRGEHGTDHRSLTYGLKNPEYKPVRPVVFKD
ncbi:hypothetical protein [Streptomyces sp. ODS28]|uniref:hypothetical protein n=1 Tax=Streptomyces sp. ODS28 TaxID=3136688 RepID=UPI0031EDBC9C